MIDVKQKIGDFFGQYPEKKLVKQQIIVRPGEDPSGVYYLVSGRVSQYDISPSGTEVVVNVFKPGAFFPMSWAINRTPNQYFFEASNDAVVRVAPADDAVDFLHREPEVLYDLLSRVYRGSDGLLRRLAHLMGGGARSRLLFEILNAAYRFGEPDDDGAVKILLKEGDLARHSGLARETVNRLIKGFKDAGLVEVRRGVLIVPDTRKLEAELGSAL